MNILILSWRGPGHPNMGGAEISTHEHAKGWVKAGYNVTLFTSFYKGAQKEENLDGIKIIRKGQQVFGVHVKAFLWYLFNKKEPYDLIIDEFHGIPFFTPLYIKVKKLAFIHEVTKEVWKLNPWIKPFNLIPYIIGSAFESFIFKLFYSRIPFMTVSDSTKSDLIKWGINAQSVTVVHNGVTLYKLKKNPPKEKAKTLIYLGAISRDKGIEDALKCFSLINKFKDDWQFWIVGKSDLNYLKRIESICENLGIREQTIFWGFVDERKKFELLSRSHIAINTSIREGWGLVNIEANSVGLPVLAYDVAGSRDSIKHGKTGFLSPAGDNQDLSTNALKLMYNKRLYQKLSKQAIEWSRNFTWDKATLESLELLKKIILSSS